MRKHLVEYDDVVNKQRELIYSERKKILGGADLKANILSMVKEELHGMVATHTGNEHGNGWDMDSLMADASTIFPLPPALNASTLSQLKPKEIEDRLIEQSETMYEQREKELGPDNMRVAERLVMLRTMDKLWVEHLTAMENMRQQAGWQTLRQVRAVDAYKSGGYKQFQTLLATIQHDVVHTIYHVGITRREAPKPAPSPMAQVAAGMVGSNKTPPPGAAGKKIGRNDPCPCGSGKKYKKCCGR
ncbi:Protein translocase subunit SecA [subsurface metagenome]